MTDDRRTEDRRADDATLASAFEVHVERYNAFEARIDEGLLGPQELQMNGEYVRKGGLVDDVEEIKKALKNGGVKIRIPPGVWALLGIIVTAVGGIAIALINNPPTP